MIHSFPLTPEEQEIEDIFYEGLISQKITPTPFIVSKEISIPQPQIEIFLSLAKQKKISPELLFSEMLQKYQSA